MKKLHRREFLRKSTFTATAAPFVWASVSSLLGQTAPNNRIRIGLVGCGGMGRGDLECFFLNQEVDCPIICDVDDAMLGKAAEICQAKRGKQPEAVKDFRRLLERKDVDVVVVATPDHWHALPSVMACQAGKDVYVEKPLAKT